jgi:Uma2 family endonuclease
MRTEPPSIPVPSPQEPWISYSEYLSRSHGEWSEWVEGKVTLMTPVGRQHQRVVSFLVALLRHFVERDQLGEVLMEAFQMKTGPGLPGRSPDVLVVTRENLSRLRATHLQGPADLVVEVVTPESRTRDREVKVEEYERGGVREYWLVDPRTELAEFFELRGGEYQAIPLGDGERFESSVLPGLWLRVSWLWPGQQPPLLEILRRWGFLEGHR